MPRPPKNKGLQKKLIRLQARGQRDARNTATPPVAASFISTGRSGTGRGAAVTPRPVTGGTARVGRPSLLGGV